MIRQAEEAGGCAVDWSMTSFNRIGGEGTLRLIWSKLKLNRRVQGRKRSCRSDHDLTIGEGNEEKKLKRSLNLRATCTRLMRILLGPFGEDEAGRALSDISDSRD